MPSLSNMQTQLQRLPEMVTRGTHVNPRGRPQPDHVISPAQATTVIGPIWPPNSSHYISLYGLFCIR